MAQLDEALCRHITHFTTGLLIVHPFSTHQTLLRGSIGAVLAVRTPAHSQDCIATSFAGAQPDCCVAGRLLAGKAYGARMQTNYRFDRVSVMRIQLQAQRYNRRRPRKVMLCRVHVFRPCSSANARRPGMLAMQISRARQGGAILPAPGWSMKTGAVWFALVKFAADCVLAPIDLLV